MGLGRSLGDPGGYTPFLKSRCGGSYKSRKQTHGDGPPSIIKHGELALRKDEAQRMRAWQRYGALVLSLVQKDQES